MGTHFIIPPMPNDIFKSLIILFPKLCCSIIFQSNLSIFFFTWHLFFGLHMGANLIKITISTRTLISVFVPFDKVYSILIFLCNISTILLSIFFWNIPQITTRTNINHIPPIFPIFIYLIIFFFSSLITRQKIIGKNFKNIFFTTCILYMFEDT